MKATCDSDMTNPSVCHRLAMCEYS